MKRLVAVWAALAVVLTGATQLRAAALPIGPGEILLAAWLMLVTLLLLSGRMVLSPVFRVFLLYWTVAAMLLSFGSIVAVVNDKIDAASTIHDMIAFSLVAVLSCFLALRWHEDSRAYHLLMARTTFLVFTVSATALLAVALVVPDLGVVRPWYGPRFRGWAENPNQMAFAALAMPYLGWYLLQHTQGWRRAVYGLGILCNIAVGWATESDSLRAAWLGSLTLVGVLAWLHPTVRRGGLLQYVFYVIIPILAVFSAVAFGPELSAEFERIGMDLYEQGGQGQTRFTAWTNGLRAMAQSPLVGWGPGAFSGLDGPFRGFEAHNTVIDWGMSTGALGVAVLVGLWAWCARRALTAGSLALVGALASIVLVLMFHYALRHPIYWLLLVLVLILSERKQSSSVS